MTATFLSTFLLNSVAFAINVLASLFKWGSITSSFIINDFRGCRRGQKFVILEYMVAEYKVVNCAGEGTFTFTVMGGHDTQAILFFQLLYLQLSNDGGRVLISSDGTRLCCTS